MNVFDLRLERARHYVAEAETRVMHQMALVAALAQQEHADRELAQKTLTVFEDTLGAMRHHLAVEIEHAQIYNGRA
jgi:hypothetical protein